MGALTVGLDGCKGGWIAAVAQGGRLIDVKFLAPACAALDAWPDAAVFAFDIPIGLSADGRRAADVEARKFLGKRAGTTVFYAPIRDVLGIRAEDFKTYKLAYAKARKLTEEVTERAGSKHGLPAQSFGLLPKIREVDKFAGDKRVYEAHPEVSFAAMAGCPLTSSKKARDGSMRRRALLAARGLVIPGALGEAGECGAPDDIADAVACAWTAARIARGEARSLPGSPQPLAGGPPRGAAIWY